MNPIELARNAKTRQKKHIFPIVVYAILWLNIATFALEVLAPNSLIFIRSFAAIPFNLTHNIVLPLPSPPIPALTIITSMFIHASSWHLFFNMLFLLVFGPTVERVCGHRRFIVLYLLSGILSEVVLLAFGINSIVAEMGASGAVAGILGAYVISFPHTKINAIVPVGCLPIFLRLPAIFVIGIWILVEILYGTGVFIEHGANQPSSLSHIAHIAGFCVGIVLIRFLSKPPQTQPSL